mmetsp:Transcript_92264/g.127162  ORF Transcript_92264/g.127162 Transcript_92264/m.127162 type:complete len:92 (+) Transcript_92264:263-538(+)
MPPPSPPFTCECSWTERFACPSSATPGSSFPFYAEDDGSQCFAYCCPPAPPAPPPPPPSVTQEVFDLAGALFREFPDLSIMTGRWLRDICG